MLSKFSFSESTTLSKLFQSYCMNVYGSSLLKFNYHNNIEQFCVSWRKVVRRIWKTPYRTHNALVHFINKCNSIVNILEKHCIECLWNLLNSENVLFIRICKYSMFNIDSSIDKNLRYFIYKYDLLYDDWFKDLNRIYVKVDGHAHSITNYDDVCIANDIRELCAARDSGLTQFMDVNQISGMIDMLCTK